MTLLLQGLFSEVIFAKEKKNRITQIETLSFQFTICLLQGQNSLCVCVCVCGVDTDIRQATSTGTTHL